MDSQGVCPGASLGCHKNDWFLFPPAHPHPFLALLALWLGLKAEIPGLSGWFALEAQLGDQLTSAPLWDPASGAG